MEISHGDPYVPAVSTMDARKAELSPEVTKQIFIFDRASQFELLSAVPETFMWVSPIPQEMCDRYGLVQRRCEAVTKIYRDVIIYRKGYSLSKLDNRFIAAVRESKVKYIDREFGEDETC